MKKRTFRLNKMCSKEDFCDWSDLNLDEILGDYTDDDLVQESTGSSDSCGRDGECEMEKPDRIFCKPARRAKDSEYVFDCPMCRKVLRSVSGFRGHVIKQHPSMDRRNFRVAEHRRKCGDTSVCSLSTENPAPETTDTATVIRNPASLSLTCTDFHDLFIANTSKVWSALSVDQLLSLPQSRQGVVMIDIAKSMIDKSDTISNFPQIEDTLRNVFVNKPLVTQSDRDLLIANVHEIRMSLEIQTAFIDYISSQVPHVERSSCQLLFQIWLRKFVAEMMVSVAQVCKPVDDALVCQKGLSVIDQNVLYHICGYMIMKLKSVSSRFKKMKSSEIIINCIAAKVPKHSGHFVEQYTKWVCKQSRGGLLYPIPQFYLLVREFDMVYRQVVATQHLTSKSLNKSNLQLAVHDSFMVKYYWSRILELACCDELSSLPALEYLIRLFLTIKGFAVTRKERDLFLLKDGKMKGKDSKKSKSLRGKLKGAK